jgi:hypothetical protein
VEKFYFVSYSSTLANQPSIPVFGNSILAIKSEHNFVLIRELENQLKRQSPQLHFVVLNFIPISKEQFVLEMKNTKI